jgi:hypothetical protein
MIAGIDAVPGVRSADVEICHPLDFIAAAVLDNLNNASFVPPATVLFIVNVYLPGAAGVAGSVNTIGLGTVVLMLLRASVVVIDDPVPGVSVNVIADVGNGGAVVVTKCPDGNAKLIVPVVAGTAVVVTNSPLMDNTSSSTAPNDALAAFLYARIGTDTLVTGVGSIPSLTRGIILFTSMIMISTPNNSLSLYGIFRNSSIVKRSVIFKVLFVGWLVGYSRTCYILIYFYFIILLLLLLNINNIIFYIN